MTSRSPSVFILYFFYKFQMHNSLYILSIGRHLRSCGKFKISRSPGITHGAHYQKNLIFLPSGYNKSWEMNLICLPHALYHISKQTNQIIGLILTRNTHTHTHKPRTHIPRNKVLTILLRSKIEGENMET